MHRAALLAAAALAVAPAAAHAGYILQFITTPTSDTQRISTQLWVGDGAVQHGSLDISYINGIKILDPTQPAWNWQSYVRPWNSDAEGYGYQMDTGSIHLTLGPSGSVQDGHITDDDGGFHLTMGDPLGPQGDGIWFGQVDFGDGKGVDHFIGRWVASFDAKVPNKLTDEYEDVPLYDGTPIPLASARPVKSGDGPSDPPTGVPEPTTLALLVSGLVGIGLARRGSVRLA